MSRDMSREEDRQIRAGASGKGVPQAPAGRCRAGDAELFRSCRGVRPGGGPYDPLEMDLLNPFAPPGSPGHLLGTDNYGRDILSRLIHGSRISLLIGIVAVTIAAVLGSCLGLLAGYYGGWVDALVMRLVEVFYAFPFLILVIGVMAVLGPSIYNVMIVLGVVSWPLYARLVRAQVMALKSEDFVKAATAMGLSDARIMFRHILPNVLTPVIVSATLGIPGAILSSAALGFLGFGVQPPWRMGRHGERGQGLHAYRLQHDYLARHVRFPRCAQLQFCRGRRARRLGPAPGQAVTLREASR